MHQPGCIQSLGAAGIHSAAQPYHKLDSKGASTQIAKQNVELQCLMPNCPGRIRDVTLERGKGKAGKAGNSEVWYTAKWHTDALAAAERAKREAAEKARREEVRFWKCVLLRLRVHSGCGEQMQAMGRATQCAVPPNVLHVLSICARVVWRYL